MRKLTAVLALLVLLLVAAPARGDVVDAIVDDCASSESGFLVGRYANADLREALRALRGEMAEYSGCADAIHEQLRENRERERAERGGGGGGGGSGGGGAGGGAGSPGAGTGAADAGGDAGGLDAGGGSAGAPGAGGGSSPAPDGAAALDALGDRAGGGATPVVTRREGFALPSAPGRELPASLLTALTLLGALALFCGGVATIARRR